MKKLCKTCKYKYFYEGHKGECITYKWEVYGFKYFNGHEGKLLEKKLNENGLKKGGK